jgi:hypothetical protein
MIRAATFFKATGALPCVPILEEEEEEEEAGRAMQGMMGAWQPLAGRWWEWELAPDESIE